MRLSIILLFALIWIALSCATQTTPQGGPKDTLPPYPTRFEPSPNQTNFKGKEISITFNEAIQLNNPKDEIIILPSPGKKTTYKIKGNTLIITPELALRDSTTYNINFREGVKDLTEGNVAIDRKTENPLHLAFSTGAIIDTLSITGTVHNALIEEIPQNITVALYSSDTFDIFEDTPDFFTKSNKEGQFQITNLKAGTYRLYAFEDKNKNLKIESRGEKYGFRADPIRLDSTSTGYKIALVNVDTRKPKINSVRNQATVNVIRANKAFTDYTLTATKPVLTHFNSNQTEIIAYYPDLEIDSTLIQLKAIDSSQQIIDTLFYIKRDKRNKIKEDFKIVSGDPVFNLETGQLEYSLTYNKPIASINKDSIYIQYDSLTRIPLPIKRFNLDTTIQKLTISERIRIDSLPKSPTITIAKGFLISIDSDTSKQIKPTLKTLDTQGTATLLVEVQTTETHFIVQLLTGNNKVAQSTRDQKKITFKYVSPELLKIRVIHDTNGNGVWDTAIHPHNTEPEKVTYYKNSENKSEVPLRANWEVGPLLIKL